MFLPWCEDEEVCEEVHWVPPASAPIAVLSVIDVIRIRAQGDVRTGGFSCWQHGRSCRVSTVSLIDYPVIYGRWGCLLVLRDLMPAGQPPV